MQRAAVLIGVNRTGGLPVLDQAAAGAQKMKEWALGQPGFDEDRIKVLTDEAGPVHLQTICDAIQELVDLSTVEQLIVYFAGHGVNKGRTEYWLLSQAPRNTNAAVNVAGSVDLARTVGIPHVVFVSDACRTAAEGINAQSVVGGQIFPADSGAERTVDVFYASSLGSPALEIPDGQASASVYRAVFTEALLEALSGERDEVIQETVEARQTVGLVRPRRLFTYLQAEVPRRLHGVRLPSGQPANQVPSAHIMSDDTAWLARLRMDRARSAGLRRDGVRSSGRGAPVETLHAVSERAVRAALAGDPAWDAALRTADANGVAGAAGLGQSVAGGAAPFGPMHFESGCGFKVRGAQLAAAHGHRLNLELLGESGTIVRVNTPRDPAASVLLELAGGTGVVLPVIPGFLAALTFEDGELTAVGYEPSDLSQRWQYYTGRADELRALRSLIASSARLGLFRLDGADAERMAGRMQGATGDDPALALYAAYACAELGRRDLVVEMQRFLWEELHLRFFDLALIARELDGGSAGSTSDIFPAFPLLAQGWGLLRARRVSLPPSLADLERHLVPSIWSVFDASGVRTLRAAITAGELR